MSEEFTAKALEMMRQAGFPVAGIHTPADVEMNESSRHAAEPTGELREQIAAWEFARRAPARYWGSGALDEEQAEARSAADEILALPALAPLLDAQAAVARVEALANELANPGLHAGLNNVAARVRRALAAS